MKIIKNIGLHATVVVMESSVIRSLPHCEYLDSHHDLAALNLSNRD